MTLGLLELFDNDIFKRLEGISDFMHKQGAKYFTPLLVYVIVDGIIQYFDRAENKKNKEAIKALKEIHNDLPPTIRPYSEIEINEHLRRLHRNIQNLLGDGLRNQSTAQKITIIRTLIQEGRNFGISRFYATSYDLPSKLITEFSDYFSDQ